MFRGYAIYCFGVLFIAFDSDFCVRHMFLAGCQLAELLLHNNLVCGINLDLSALGSLDSPLVTGFGLMSRFGIDLVCRSLWIIVRIL
jgi:hypothetical protein